jgi:FkbH-like protein
MLNSYTEILAKHKNLKQKFQNESYPIGVISNISINMIREILEFKLMTEHIPADTEIGTYNNIVQDSLRFANKKAVIIFWELSDLCEGFHYKAENISEKELHALIENTKQEIDLVLDNLKETPLLIFNLFSPMPFSYNTPGFSLLEKTATTLNNHLYSKKNKNLYLCDLNKVMYAVSFQEAIDLRYYYSSKALYKPVFFQRYSDHITPVFLHACAMIRKALILDCDNTLWKGIIGEDGFDTIDMSHLSKKGVFFHEVQHLLKNLANKGILLGLCSKNNPEDVEEVLLKHKDMLLKNENITIKKINWTDKVHNLKDIASELNIGLDSLVFIDDSDFEVNLVREKLPQIKTFQVPEKLHEYPCMIRKISHLFYKPYITREDLKKVDMYKDHIQREKAKKQYHNIDDYLASLELEIEVFHNDKGLINRMSQLAQKTNQFNCTNKRYTENDINNLLHSGKEHLFAYSLRDKYGDYGVSALIILELSGTEAVIDTFLMSCRIIGRNIEFAIMDQIIDFLIFKNINQVRAAYHESPKNTQVKELYDRCNFTRTEENEKTRKYKLNTHNYKTFNYKYISLKNETKNC